MYQIELLNKISAIGLDLFNQDRYSYGEGMVAPDAILVRSASMHDMTFNKSVQAIVRAGAGVNNIPVESCAEQGIVVFNTPGANANAVKEMVLLSLLISSRKVVDSMAWVKTLKGEGDAVGKLVEKGKSAFVGPEITGKTLGVVGLGAIGVLVANAAAALGMNVMGYDPFISIDAAWGLSANVKNTKSLAEIYEKCDYITLHIPCNSETRGMINTSTIASMKTGVRILNFARGELVHSDDILTALKDGKVNCYVTDFPNDDQIGVDGVVAFPHLGASTPESEDNCAKMAVKQVQAYLEHGNIINSVNFPNATMARSGKNRVCIIHKNIPAQLAQISTACSDNGVNIENMLNQSRGNFAYTMIDTNDTVKASALEQLSAIDGVIRLRIL